MAKVKNQLTNRLKSSKASIEKVKQLARTSSSGARSSFEGIFESQDLSDKEKSDLRDLLTRYQTKGSSVSLEKDFDSLKELHVEVKAITKQAIILHGERIEKAQTILKSYKDGAFSAWLVQTYGNRQTPYNLLQYYSLWKRLNEGEKEKLEEIPRQAIYTLASRDVDFEQKLSFIRSYKGQTKQELLEMIRCSFPLNDRDRRQGTPKAIRAARTLFAALTEENPQSLSATQAKEALALLLQAQHILAQAAGFVAQNPHSQSAHSQNAHSQGHSENSSENAS